MKKKSKSKFVLASYPSAKAVKYNNHVEIIHDNMVIGIGKNYRAAWAAAYKNTR